MANAWFVTKYVCLVTFNSLRTLHTRRSVQTIRILLLRWLRDNFPANLDKERQDPNAVASGREGGNVRLCIVTIEPRQEIARTALRPQWVKAKLKKSKW